jgi:molybdate transport system substrate-binding protein
MRPALLAALLTLSPVAARSAELGVAAASDLKFAMDELVADYQKRNPDAVVKVSYGSSGNFFAQLQQQAPFDVFFSADFEYPRRLEADGHTLAGTTFVYAIGRLALWLPRASPVDPGAPGLRALLAPEIQKVAIANPRHAPYGRAAEAALRHFGIYDAVQPKLVLGENVAQAAQFAQSGAADVALIAHSLALAPAMQSGGRFSEVPLASYPRMEQGGVILKWARDPALARAFRDFVQGKDGRAILRRWGFLLPGE